MSKFCCDILGDMFEDAGKKGFSVVPERQGKDTYHIFLQGRNQDTELKEGKLTVFERAISYCPFCGSKLSDVIDKHKVQIDLYADRNKSLLLRF
jgi:hypothetical protein